MKPIYENLSSDAQLNRGVGGFTQNYNASLNQLIWRISPKILSGTSTICEIAADVSACYFNKGNFAYLTFMEEMRISTGTISYEWTREEDTFHISRADSKAAEATKEACVLKI